jgi:hypothetical protein
MARTIRLFSPFFLLLYAPPVYAARDWGSCVSQTGDTKNVATISCIETLFENAVWGIIALAGVGLFIMLIIGGYGFLFSGGDPKKLEKARGTLTNAIIGIVVIVTAYLIIRTIGVFTGINLDVFQVIIP